jgi:hypothetical protein
VEKRAGCLAQAEGRPQGTVLVLVPHQIYNCIASLFKIPSFLSFQFAISVEAEKTFFYFVETFPKMQNL